MRTVPSGRAAGFSLRTAGNWRSIEQVGANLQVAGCEPRGYEHRAAVQCVRHVTRG